MSGVINDVEALAEFRASLMRFNAELAENFATIRTQWRDLGEVWRDDMYHRFGEALEEVLPGIESYLRTTEEHEAHLAVLIERLQAYLDVGVGVGGAVPARRGPAPGQQGSARADRDRQEQDRREQSRR
jgi:hypothetical protein